MNKELNRINKIAYRCFGFKLTNLQTLQVLETAHGNPAKTYLGLHLFIIKRIAAEHKRLLRYM